MTDRFHVGTFLWGVVLTLVGAALAALGFGWWELETMDLRYVAPLFVILGGAVIMVGALTSGRRDRADS